MAIPSPSRELPCGEAKRREGEPYRWGWKNAELCASPKEISNSRGRRQCCVQRIRPLYGTGPETGGAYGTQPLCTVRLRHLRSRGKAGSIQIGRILPYCTVYFVLLMFLNPNSTDTGLNTTYFPDPYAVRYCTLQITDCSRSYSTSTVRATTRYGIVSERMHARTHARMDGRTDATLITHEQTKFVIEARIRPKLPIKACATPKLPGITECKKRYWPCF